MALPHDILPELKTLSSEIEAAVTRTGVISKQLTVISRRQNENYSTHPSEILTCSLGDEQLIELFCKYSQNCDHDFHGHRGGVEYELAVYRHLLQALNVSKPTFYGGYRGTGNGRVGLILEYITDGEIVSDSGDPDAMTKAARWIGEFHALCESRVSDSNLSFIKRYDSDYYSGWARRTLMMNRQSKLAGQWLETVCNHIHDVIALLGQNGTTILHGEYYPKNILYKNDLIYPVDWESAAIGCGEIDLAALTDKWDQDAREALEVEYRNARWPESHPSNFHDTLCAARICMQLRWLGDRAEWAPYLAGRMKQLRREAKIIGLN